jgi:NAD(P)H-nitrite reductase large subunit
VTGAEGGHRGLEIEFEFQYHPFMTVLHRPEPVAETLAVPQRGPAMTRCECAELPFEMVARRLNESGQSLQELGRRTGCGQTCTACLPDLERYLRSCSRT